MKGVLYAREKSQAQVFFIWTKNMQHNKFEKKSFPDPAGDVANNIMCTDVKKFFKPAYTSVHNGS